MTCIACTKTWASFHHPCRQWLGFHHVLMPSVVFHVTFPTNWEEFPVRKAWSGSNDFTIRTLHDELEGTRHGSHSPPWLPRRMVHPHVAFKEIRPKRGKGRQRSNRCRSWTMESGNLERIPDGIWNSWSSHGKQGGCTDACSEIHSYYGRSLLGPVWNWQLQEKASCWDHRCFLHRFVHHDCEFSLWSI